MGGSRPVDLSLCQRQRAPCWGVPSGPSAGRAALMPSPAGGGTGHAHPQHQPPAGPGQWRAGRGGEIQVRVRRPAPPFPWLRSWRLPTGESSGRGCGCAQKPYSAPCCPAADLCTAMQRRVPGSVRGVSPLPRHLTRACSVGWPPTFPRLPPASTCAARARTCRWCALPAAGWSRWAVSDGPSPQVRCGRGHAAMQSPRPPTACLTDPRS